MLSPSLFDKTMLIYYQLVAKRLVTIYWSLTQSTKGYSYDSTPAPPQSREGRLPSLAGEEAGD